MKENSFQIQASSIEFYRFRQEFATSARHNRVIGSPVCFATCYLLQYKNNWANLSGEKENTVKFSGVYVFGEYAKRFKMKFCAAYT